MNVSQIMNRSVETVRPDDSLACAAQKMWDHDVGCLPVVGPGGVVAGMITDRDVCMGAYTQGRRLDEIRVSTAMSRDVFTCSASDGIIEAEETMRSRQVRRLPVIDEAGMLVGIVSLNDLAREAEREVGRRAREVSAQEVTATLAAVCAPRRPTGLEMAAA
jgi:CBS-domain-containing membrane protein